ncbi:suppressor of fused domain protein [Microbacterium sp. YY-03]|uniref:suppressor of fused domain protein n=1 Tax=Microbacterium sp. YY-03 TaxID=3421636 RepID=UPI003D18227E
MIDQFEVLDRILTAVGAEPTEPPMKYSTRDESRSVGILAVPDCPQRGITTWATIGASTFETPVRRQDDLPIRVEFVAAVDARLENFAVSVSACAFALGADVRVGPGTIYRDVVSPIHPATTTPHLFSVPPFVWANEFESIEGDDAYITWLQLVPITDDEAAFAAERGSDALGEVFMKTQPDFFSFERVSALLPEA